MQKKDAALSDADFFTSIVLAGRGTPLGTTNPPADVAKAKCNREYRQRSKVAVNESCRRQRHEQSEINFVRCLEYFFHSN